MSNAELWDLDTSGGIMEQIQMLVAPPVSSDNLRRSRRRRDRDNYRRPGRTPNHDCCDSCKEGGDLLCCDRCPAAFHLLCHDPPLIEEELPPGEWLCHKCKITPLEVKDEDNESTSSKSSNRSMKSKRSAHSADSEADSREHPLKTLAKAARLMNPLQFDVGKEISCGKPLPGSSKRVYGRATRYIPKKQAHELDNGLVPLPAKTCFSCNKSCRIAPLIQCDYCPLLFHLDCLNPPLTSLPTGRWMCPNHVEHFLDSDLLCSQSLTERLRLWDKYTGLVDSHTVKVDFLSKVHRRDPMFRFKRKLPSRPTVNVPEPVKRFYKYPTYLLPEPSKPSRLILPMANSDGCPSLEEQEEWLTSVVAMQGSIAKYLTQQQFKKSFGSRRTDTTMALFSKPTASVAPVVHKDSEVSSSSSSSSSALSFTSSSQSSAPFATHPVVNVKSTSTSTLSPSTTATTSSHPQRCSSSSGPVNANDPSICDNSTRSTLSSYSISANGDTVAVPLSALDTSSFINGPFEVTTRGAVSLLSNSMTIRHPNLSAGSSPMVNGDSGGGFNRSCFTSLDCSEPTSAALATAGGRSSRSDSTDSAISGGHSMWTDGDAGGWSEEGGQFLDSNGRNVLVSTLNRSGDLGGPNKVTPQTAKVILPSGKTSFVNSNNSNNSSSKTAASKTPLQGAVNPSPKVYTVSAAKPPGCLPITSQNKPTSTTTVTASSVGSSSSIINASSPTMVHLNSMLQQWLEGNPDIELTKIDQKLTQILAWQRLQQLLSSSASALPSARIVSVSNSSGLPYKKGLIDGFLSQQDSVSEVRARAVICPLTGKGEAIPMSYRTMNLGKGTNADVNLLDFGHCNYISGHHATIFYDEVTRHFELLNYSEHGTTVDNVLYSCDFTDKPATTPVRSPLVNAVQEIISKGRGDNNSSNCKSSKPGSQFNNSNAEATNHEGTLEDRLKMCGKASKMLKACHCKAPPNASLLGSSGAGWEGTALLHHGSYLKLGCLQFVFSIVDHAPDQLRNLSSGGQDGVSCRSSFADSTTSSSSLLSFTFSSSSTSYSTSPGASLRVSSMPLISSSPFLHQHQQQPQQHQQQPMSLLKSHLRASEFS